LIQNWNPPIFSKHGTYVTWGVLMVKNG
jgi:hypothetical protein